MTKLAASIRLRRRTSVNKSDHGIALFPLRSVLLRMGHSGGFAIAALLLLIGWIAGISGIIEQAVYTSTFDLRLSLIHLPEIVLQTLLYGYLLIAWERRADRASLTTPVRSAGEPEIKLTISRHPVTLMAMELCYSARSACIGSMRVTRRAGR
jgi:hypothetical protein